MEKINIRLYTGVSLLNEKEMKSFLKSINNSLIRPSKFDSIERPKKVFSEEKYNEMIELLNLQSSLFISGTKDGFTVHIQNANEGLYTWDLYLKLKGSNNELKINKWLDWTFDLCGLFPILFGCGFTPDEFKAKHEIEIISNSGLRSVQYKGRSIQEFYRFLPGIYWLTIFGKTLVKFFELDIIDKIPLSVLRKIDNGQMAIILDMPFNANNIENKIENEKKIAGFLGSKYFFEKEDNKFTKEIPSFVKELKSLHE